MRDDDLTLAPPPEAHSPTGKRRSARRPRWIWPLALAVLVPLTSLAVASVSVWLVVPYLVLMGAILFAPARGPAASQVARPAHRSASVGGAEMSAPSSESAKGAERLASVEDGEGTADVATQPAPPKTRRGRGRGRARARTAEPGEPPRATWVRIGPGKFVRVEGPAPGSEEAGPGEASESALPEPHWVEEERAEASEPDAQPAGESDLTYAAPPDTPTAVAATAELELPTAPAAPLADRLETKSPAEPQAVPEPILEAEHAELPLAAIMAPWQGAAAAADPDWPSRGASAALTEVSETPAPPGGELAEQGDADRSESESDTHDDATHPDETNTELPCADGTGPCAPWPAVPALVCVRARGFHRGDWAASRGTRPTRPRGRVHPTAARRLRSGGPARRSGRSFQSRAPPGPGVGRGLGQRAPGLGARPASAQFSEKPHSAQTHRVRSSRRAE